MKSDAKVIKALQDALANELTAIHHYVADARAVKANGYCKLGHHIMRQARDEMQHAKMLMDRLYLYDEVPAMNKLFPMALSDDPKAILESMLTNEQDAMKAYALASATAEDAKQVGDEELFEELAVDEECHAAWAEKELAVIAKMGYPQWLEGWR